MTAELVGSIEATVVRGRCLPYGEGITYWPVVEVLKQLDSTSRRGRCPAALRSLLGESEAPTSAEEIAWAFRKLLEERRPGRPLVVVFDDVQWGEDTFFDLVEHVALLSARADPAALPRTARLVERRPDWPLTLRLEPLPPEATCDELIPASLVATCVRGSRRGRRQSALPHRRWSRWPERPTATCSSRRTFRHCSRPASTSSSLAERSVLERAPSKARSSTAALCRRCSDDRQVPALAALVRKELITARRPQLPGEDGSVPPPPLRDAAYEALPKGVRSELHRRFADWLEERGAES